jgi:hypothetical protein
MVGERDDAKEVSEELLGRSSVFMSPNRDLLEPSVRSMIFPYSSPSTSTPASLKSTITAGAVAGSGTVNA